MPSDYLIDNLYLDGGGSVAVVAKIAAEKFATEGSLDLGLPMSSTILDFHSNHGHPQSAGLHLPEGACFMSTMRVYTRDFRESAVGLVLSQCLSIRVAAEDLGMPYHTLHGWVRDQRRARRKTVVKATPKTMDDAQARVRELEAEVRKLTLEKDILKKAAAYFAREQS